MYSNQEDYTYSFIYKSINFVGVHTTKTIYQNKIIL